MITQDDIDAMKPDDPLVQHMQFKIREAFELGYRAGKPGITEPNEWRASWLASGPRKWLVNNGIISGRDEWR